MVQVSVSDYKKSVLLAYRVVTNTEVNYDDYPYAKVKTHDNELWVHGIGHYAEVHTCISQEAGVEVEADVDCLQLGKTLSMLQEQVNLYMGEGDMLYMQDKQNITVAMENYVTGVTERESYREQMEDIRKTGHAIPLKDFANILRYFLQIKQSKTKEEADYLGEIYFNGKKGYIVEQRYISVVDMPFPVPMVISVSLAQLLVEAMKGIKEETIYLKSPKDGTYGFVIGQHYICLQDMSTELKDIRNTIRSYKKSQQFTIPLATLEQYIKVVTFFSGKEQDEILFKIEQGQLSIRSDSKGAYGQGQYAVPITEKYEFTLNTQDMNQVLKGLNVLTDKTTPITVDFNEEQTMLVIHHTGGYTLIGIYGE